MTKLIISCYTLFLGFSVLAQNPQVPSEIEFAGMTLQIKKSAQNKIQEEVDKLRKNKTYFDAYVAKADLFFPLIEQVFDEVDFPEDFKYLIIQESAFKADAVSKSNAVGYWQFKEATAKEVGMRVDRYVDERKNIISASKGAALYMSKNNARLDNWIYALLSYNLGLGGVQSHVKDKNRGATTMEINSSTYWYVIKFLAHKVAFERDVRLNELKHHLIIDYSFGGEKLNEVAKKYNIPQDELVIYNKWLKSARIPEDKPYAVVVPVKRGEHEDNNIVTEEDYEDQLLIETKKEGRAEYQAENRKKEDAAESSEPNVQEEAHEENEIYKINRPIKVNGVDGMTAKYGDNSQRMAILGDISKNKFLNYNDLESYDAIIPGQVYYFEKKKSKAVTSFHIVEHGETVWSISQKYAVKEWSIRSKNRMSEKDEVEPGRKLWLNKFRPHESPVEFNGGSTNDKPVVGNDSARVHTVVAGESLFSIAQQHHVELTDLKLFNGLKSDDIDEGVQLNVPVLPADKGFYMVKKGDTLYSLSRRFDLEMDDIIRTNDLESTKLTIGQRLKIK